MVSGTLYHPPLQLSWQRQLFTYFFVKFNQPFPLRLRMVPGAGQSKLPVITGPVKLFCFPFQLGVSKVLTIVQESHQVNKQNELYQRSEHNLLFSRFCFRNMISSPLSYRSFEKRVPGLKVKVIPQYCIAHAYARFTRHQRAQMSALPDFISRGPGYNQCIMGLTTQVSCKLRQY